MRKKTFSLNEKKNFHTARYHNLFIRNYKQRVTLMTDEGRNWAKILTLFKLKHSFVFSGISLLEFILFLNLKLI